ncbi:MAG TPA: hypothetical protein VK452_08415 [Dissulfurispiraceae bacterium]|nr:hypothetical protein [Dissulfurispiraceae bacterium]
MTKGFIMTLIVVACISIFSSDGALAISPCIQGDAVRIWSAPLVARPGEKLEIIAVATDSELSEIVVTDPAGRRTALMSVKAGGPPWSLRGSLAAPAAGTYSVEAQRAGRTAACTKVEVGGRAGDRGKGTWDPATQALYATWVEHLFDAPPQVSLSFPSLEPVLRDPNRNFLYNYLRKGEDMQIPARPDCADLSFFLHGYFAWKLGLPISYRTCDRGSSHRAPRCSSAEINRSFVGTAASPAVFRQVSRRFMDRANSGNGRTALNTEDNDFYPVALDRASLWPGTIYADPYGHTLIIVKWVPQTSRQSGLLLAVDAQPDNSVARKRFWEGNFLFAQTPSAGPGFKAYRFPVFNYAKRGWHPVPNSALTKHSVLPSYSLEQANLTPELFYARMEQLINPLGLDTEAAYTANLDALMEQLETRVRSVDNGENYMRSHPGTIAPMPRGLAIFETSGLWEDFSTPSRDMRILIALKVLADLPERIRRHPELFILSGESPATAASRIERLHSQKLKERFITYTRSNGSTWRLSLGEIYQRRSGLEIAYNPNDCVERRWAATPGTPEFSTCGRQAPVAQRARMEEYRIWFREARRPPR